ncbi:trehalose-phosphatase [Halovivax cerinus]|uniref:Trehalose 6-phosphate phosphatase n=1 Tax=Halovivax cerinus TaxID=1487865 RepID=A0ABD5NMF6_9EURY|nr:trehalose-phosphatase [Halovivax cerinus]
MTDSAAVRCQSVPRRLSNPTSRLGPTLENASHLLCCLDFDGTLAPIVDDPATAVMPQATERVLDRLGSSRSITVAIVSGRSVTDLRTRVGSPAILVGNHGLERFDPGPHPPNGQSESNSAGRHAVHPIAAAATPRIETCSGVLETVLDPIPNATVEHKGLTGTVHDRTVPESAVPVCRSLTRDVIERVGDDRVVLTEGARILEFRPAIEWDKGDAVGVLEDGHPPGTVLLYCGDDTTDEDAFRVLSDDDVGIRVGDATPSYASFRVDSPQALVGSLEWLADHGPSLLAS